MHPATTHAVRAIPHSDVGSCREYIYIYIYVYNKKNYPGKSFSGLSFFELSSYIYIYIYIYVCVYLSTSSQAFNILQITVRPNVTSQNNDIEHLQVVMKRRPASCTAQVQHKHIGCGFVRPVQLVCVQLFPRIAYAWGAPTMFLYPVKTSRGYGPPNTFVARRGTWWWSTLFWLSLHDLFQHTCEKAWCFTQISFEYQPKTFVVGF